VAASNRQRQVIRGARLWSGDPKIGELRSADVLIDGDRIAAVAPDLGPLDAVEFSGTDRILLAGSSTRTGTPGSR